MKIPDNRSCTILHAKKSKATIEKMKSIRALQIAIKEIFARNDHQNKVITDIYQMILPQWNDIEKLGGHPACGEKLWFFICELFIKFDKEHHPQTMAGGAWINFGFSSDKCLAPWEINLSGCPIIDKETKDVESPITDTII